MPQINSVRGLSGIKAISKYEVNLTSVFNLPRSQAIFCIGYNVNLQTAVAAILVFVESPKSIVSEVLVVVRLYQNVKSILQAVFKISRSQAIVAGRTDGRPARPTDGRPTGPTDGWMDGQTDRAIP